MHNYLLVFKFVIQIVWILMGMLLEMSLFVAWTHHICLPFFKSIFLFSWWFQQFTIFINVFIVFSQLITTFLCSNKVSFFIPIVAIQRYGCIPTKRKWSTNCRLLNVKGSLLVSIYVHNILPPFCLCLAISLIMPCTLVHPFILFSNIYRMQPPTLQIHKIGWALTRKFPI
jgi:hypothetical protein